MKHLCVVGNPIAHSKSPEIHRQFAAESGVQIDYQRKQIPLGEFATGVQALLDEGYSGFSVTVPFKEEAYTLADIRSARATLAGAANTLYLQEGKLHADNTDGPGLVADLQAKGIVLEGKSLLVFGAGGAAKGIIGPLLEAGVILKLANRTFEKAVRLADQFATYGDIQAVALAAPHTKTDIMINATSVGLTSTESPWDNVADALTQQTVCYDLVYSPQGPTEFMTWAQSHGAKTAYDGYGMLIEQAKLQFNLFTGVEIA